MVKKLTEDLSQSICEGKMQNLIMICKKTVSFRLVVRLIIESENRKYMLNMRKEQSWSIQEGCEMPLQQD